MSSKGESTGGDGGKGRGGGSRGVRGKKLRLAEFGGSLSCIPSHREPWNIYPTSMP